MSERIFVRHFRLADPLRHGTVHATGGATVAARIEDGAVHYGISICSLEDNFHRREGYVRALGRMSSWKSDRHFSWPGGDTAEQLEAYFIQVVNDKFREVIARRMPRALACALENSSHQILTIRRGRKHRKPPTTSLGSLL